MERRGIILGCWDLLHIGHIRAIQKAKTHCDHLIVGVYTDACIRRYKKINPIIPDYWRKEMISHLPYVDEVILIHTRPPVDLKFDILFVSEEWINTDPLPMRPKNFYGQVIFLPYSKFISTRKIKNWVIENES